MTSYVKERRRDMPNGAVRQRHRDDPRLLKMR